MSVEIPMRRAFVPPVFFPRIGDGAGRAPDFFPNPFPT